MALRATCPSAAMTVNGIQSDAMVNMEDCNQKMIGRR
jgi:hypothetical protein